LWEFDRYGSINVAIEHSEQRDEMLQMIAAPTPAVGVAIVQTGGLDPSSP